VREEFNVTKMREIGRELTNLNSGIIGVDSAEGIVLGRYRQLCEDVEG
tara:strand:+ start:1189 stop:1332 length:144 start_codon:yes stop_codon:yes gene_type:complete